MNQNDFENLMRALEVDGGKSAESIGKSAAAALSEEKRKQIEAAMSDPQYLKSLLSTPKAQEILRRFQKGEK